jgi:hypothetical protein
MRVVEPAAWDVRFSRILPFLDLKTSMSSIWVGFPVHCPKATVLKTT